MTNGIAGAREDYDGLIERIGDARFVLIGEASHGTHEFYRERSRITRRLIAEKGFTAVAIEGDWPSAARVNRYVRGSGTDRSVELALDGFERFPAWMWRNTDVLQFVGWLRRHNDAVPAARRAGFYGLDLYSLFDSIAEVLRYLERADPHAARRARERYACFEQFGADSQRYGYATAFGVSKSCEDEVVAQLLEMRHRAAAAQGRDPDERFHAEQNARLVRNAEEYYRTMFRGHVSSWNLRDSHMAETLEALALHLTGESPAKIVVWAHNSHVGDASATEMGEHGEHTVGQLVRQRYRGQTALIGMTTYHGTVIAASDWGGRAERMRVRDALPGSHEAVFHETRLPAFWLSTDGFRERRLERAIGVIYLPQSERMSHYFHATLAEQFDFILHFDETRALEPLERAAAETGEAPETYPVGV
jgi:erythromycin esterase-like protein